MAWTIAKDAGAVSIARWSAEIRPAPPPPAPPAPAPQVPPAPALPPPSQATFTAPWLSDPAGLIEKLPVMIQVLDGDGRILQANQATLDTLGYAAKEVAGLYCLDLVGRESREFLEKEVFPEFFITRRMSNVDVEFVRRDGSRFDAMISVIGYPDETGRIIRSIAVASDMSKRANAQALLRRSEQRFRASFEAAAHGMAIVSADGRLVAVNRALTEMLDVATGDLLAKNFMDMVAEADLSRVEAQVSRIMIGEEASAHLEIGYRGGAGRPVYGLTSISGVRDQNERLEQFIVQVVDITGRRKTEEHLRQAQKMEAIGQLTGGIAHDFNNLLTVIIGNLQLVESALESNPRAARRAQEAITAATKGSELTRQLLAFARRQSLDQQEISVNGLVQGLAPLIRRSVGESVEIKVDLAVGNPLILADPTQLETSLLNLANNARDAMPKGGRLTIETAETTLDEAYAAEHDEVTPGPYVMIAVSDTGTGIAPELVDQIFQPFFTTKEVGKGTGLGLSMVFGFIKQTGGHIAVYSEVGVGTSFKLYFPLRGAGAEAAKPSWPAQAPKPKEKILVVEDQVQVREVAVGLLESLGYQVVEAGDGMQALEMLHQHPDIALLFTDVVMPGGMNGFDLSQAALLIRPDLKVIHTSGYPKGALVHQEEPRIKDNLIMKPYQRDELRRVVEETLAGKGRGAGEA